MAPMSQKVGIGMDPVNLYASLALTYSLSTLLQCHFGEREAVAECQRLRQAEEVVLQRRVETGLPDPPPPSSTSHARPSNPDVCL